MKETMTGTYVRNDEYFNFDFYTELSIANKLKFVNSVTSLVVDGENYNSVIRDLVFDFCLIDIMTTVDTSDLWTSDFFIEDVEEFLEETNIVDIVKANVSPVLFEEINKAIDLDIQYKTGIHTNPLSEALASLVNTLENKINGIDLDSMMNMVQKFSGMIDEFTPESIVNAYLDSDVHQKNLEEIAESKNDKTIIAENLDEAIKTVKDEVKPKTKKKTKK